jgi:cation diffusion facilitator CzcD-associated flavoprotein CzcO
MARQLGSYAGDELLDVVVIGGSQAGLAMAWHLARQHLRFVVLEAGPEPGHTWRSRWDSLTLFTPAQYDALPGMPFPGPPTPTRPKNRSPATSTPMQRSSTCRSGSTPGSPP